LPAYFFAYAADEAAERLTARWAVCTNRRARIARDCFRLLGEVVTNEPNSWLAVGNRKFFLKMVII